MTIGITGFSLILTLLLTVVALGQLISLTSAQNCGCAANECCSHYGYCGTTHEYCGSGCKEGPCEGSSGGGSSGGGGSSSSVASIVTESFFDGIINQAAGSDCNGKGFYTRSAFLSALGDYPGFGTTGSQDDIKREIAAFFAHVTHETGSFCHIEETGTTDIYCDTTKTQWPCTPGKSYHGRGPIQITWNYNYGAAGSSINFDGLNSPETVAKDPIISFKTAFWIWMINNDVHNKITSGQGFGATIRAINSLECNGGNTPAVDSRVQYYTQYCSQLGVSTGAGDLRC